MSLFLTTFMLVFLAELPDKTAIAILLMATKERPLAVFIGVASAFIIQSAIAVTFGGFFRLLPPDLITIGSALLFFFFAWQMWRSRNETDEVSEAFNETKSFWKATWSSFLVIFIAEWGDLTQLATATLSARYNSPFTIFLAATLALWTSTAIVIVIGTRLKKSIKPKLLKELATLAFVTVGIFCLRNIFHTPLSNFFTTLFHKGH